MVLVDTLQDAISDCTPPVHLEESACSHKGMSPKLTAEDFRCSRPHESVNASYGISENICLKNGHSGPIFDACQDEFCVSIRCIFLSL